jgi:hypothetical protein
MPRISLLLPCLQADSAFEDTLASLLRTRPAGADVIVVHDGTYQDQYGLAGEVEYAVPQRVIFSSGFGREPSLMMAGNWPVSKPFPTQPSALSAPRCSSRMPARSGHCSA